VVEEPGSDASVANDAGKAQQAEIVYTESKNVRAVTFGGRFFLPWMRYLNTNLRYHRWKNNLPNSSYNFGCNTRGLSWRNSKLGKSGTLLE
jgi:hypothetical protein